MTSPARLSRLILLGALALYGLLLAQPINLTNADLGRHLKNGEVWLQARKPIVTNWYSYTEPDHPVLTHHWGSGIVLFLVWKLTGFVGVHLFFLFVSLVTLWLVMRLAIPRVGAGLSALLLVLVLSLLAERREVRPEAFTYLFSAVFLRQLWRFRDGLGSARSLWCLPFLEVLWVNAHIYFILGPALIGAVLVESLCTKSLRGAAPTLAGLLAVTGLATLVNPFGVSGALAPLTIFHNYGYRVLENQPVWFLERLIANPNLLLFKIAFGVLAASLVAGWMRGGRRLLSTETILAVAASGMAWGMLRNFTLFGFLALPLMAANIGSAFKTHVQRYAKALNVAGCSALGLALVLVLARIPTPILPVVGGSRGLGLEAGNHLAAEFWKREQIRGPIFNNYDIGGYLIFHLFPTERVFVDNRAEAYSAKFFQDVYVPMQEDEAVWQAADRRYRFNAIVFYRHDATPWGQGFLIRRVQDPAWAPVFVDRYVLIFLKRNETNQQVIERHELPKQMFRVVPTAMAPGKVLDRLARGCQNTAGAPPDDPDPREDLCPLRQA